MRLNKKIKKKVLNKSDSYNFYKNECENYSKKYQNTIDNLEKNYSKNLALNKKIHAQIIQIKDNQQQIENNINKFIYFSKDSVLFADKYCENKDNIFDKLNLINLRLTNHNKYLLYSNRHLRDKFISALDLNDEIISNKMDNQDSLLTYYKQQCDFYKQEFFDLLEKQNEYESFINEMFDSDLKDIVVENKKNESILKEYALRQKNIAYVLKGFPTLSETFILNELKWLRYNNYDVKVFAYGDPQKPVNLDFDLEVIRFDGSLNNLEELLIEHKIDLMHTHFVYPTVTNLTYPLAEKLKIPFTLFAHAYDIFIKDIDKMNNVGNISKSEYCKAIFTLSNYHKNYLRERNVSENKIYLTKQATEYFISPLNQKFNKIRNIVSISRFVEKKGIDTIIDAANLLKNEDIVFSIYGFGILENDLRKKIDDLKLTNISIKGSLDNSNEVRNVLNKSDLLVSPCKIAKNGDRDGIPTIIFEAMAQGVPVLTTNVSAIPEVITDNENGFLIESNNPEQLKNKIKDIINLSPKQLFDIRKKAQNDVQKLSSIEKTMNAVMNVWANI